MTDYDLWLLFASAFISSTLMPGGSEALFGAMAWQGQHPSAALLAVATLGNSLGGMTSWGIGRLLAQRYPATSLPKPAHHQAIARVRRWGAPILLLSWLPIIGDPLCVAAGWLKVHWLAALILIALGKGARYGAILLALN